MVQMRRKDRLIENDEALDILERCEYGIIAFISPENTPYAVPLNYVFCKDENAVYMHSAKTGRKISCIENDQSVHFTVVDKSIIAAGFTTRYSSVMVEGTASLLSDDNEKSRVLMELCKKLYPSMVSDMKEIENTNGYIAKHLAHTAIIKIDIKEISGKANKGE